MCGCQGAMQSFHRNMMKVPNGKRVVSILATLDDDLYSNDGTDVLPHSREGLPRLWDPIPIPLRCGDLFILYGDLVHVGGCTRLSKPESWWKRVLFLGIATIPVTYSLLTTHVLTTNTHLRARRTWLPLVTGTKPQHPTTKAVLGGLLLTTRDRTALRTNKPAAILRTPKQNANSDRVQRVQQLVLLTCWAFQSGVTCLLPVLSSTLRLALHPLPAPPPNLFRLDDHSNVRMSAHSGHGHTRPRH